jgi:hypothetical protein
MTATLLVFTFVALWHDLSFRLLAWGWLVSLFILPELIASHFVSEKKVRIADFEMQRADLPDYSLRIQFGSALWYRHLAAGGAVLNILLMMTANLVGFVLGIDGVRYLGEQLVSSSDGASRSCIRFSILMKTLNRLVLDVRSDRTIVHLVLLYLLVRGRAGHVRISRDRDKTRHTAALLAYSMDNKGCCISIFMSCMR